MSKIILGTVRRERYYFSVVIRLITDAYINREHTTLRSFNIAGILGDLGVFRLYASLTVKLVTELDDVGSNFREQRLLVTTSFLHTQQLRFSFSSCQ